MPYDTIITLEIERKQKALENYFSKFTVSEHEMKEAEEKSLYRTPAWIFEQEDKRFLEEARQFRDEFLELL